MHIGDIRQTHEWLSKQPLPRIGIHDEGANQHGNRYTQTLDNDQRLLCAKNKQTNKEGNKQITK